ncbi:MAG: hypothetical protein DRJ42_09210 [Deltaproteobacteria bacterium]|nr:MAG: hypothetical protein DRJ42_09210 [Deltaproteobacteria bacterium]
MTAATEFEDRDHAMAHLAHLIATASGAPIDTPRLALGPATEALALAGELLGRDDGDDPDEARRAYLEVQRANALRLVGREHDEEAQLLFEAVLARSTDDQQNAAALFDLGLFHKSRGRFAEAFDAFARARDAGFEGKNLFFNLAAAATALGRGEAARDAWAALGIDLEVNAAGMPYGAVPGPVEVRVPTRGSGHGVAPVVPDEALSFEVVSVAPISPCHGVVQTPTLRDAPVDYGDVILWDGTPVAMKEVDGRAVPRFPLLEILRRGDERRFRFVALEQVAGDLDGLGAALPDGAELFALEARVEVVCPRCAAGDAFVKHEHGTPEPHRIIYGKLIAAPDLGLPSLSDALTEAMRGAGRVSLAVPELYDALGDAKRAGQEHQAFRGIEQVALRKGLAGTH